MDLEDYEFDRDIGYGYGDGSGGFGGSWGIEILDWGIRVWT